MCCLDQSSQVLPFHWGRDETACPGKKSWLEQQYLWGLLFQQSLWNYWSKRNAQIPHWQCWTADHIEGYLCRRQEVDWSSTHPLEPWQNFIENMNLIKKAKAKPLFNLAMCQFVWNLSPLVYWRLHLGFIFTLRSSIRSGDALCEGFLFRKS